MKSKKTAIFSYISTKNRNILRFLLFFFNIHSEKQNKNAKTNKNRIKTNSNLHKTKI